MYHNETKKLEEINRGLDEKLLLTYVRFNWALKSLISGIPVTKLPGDFSGFLYTFPQCQC